jgi:hypothetical protein
MVKKKQHKITDPEPEDYRIIGVASNEKPFSVCWEFNRILSTGLTLGEPLKRERKAFNDHPSFMTFRAEDDHGNRFLLIENITAEGFFAENWNMFRYLFIVEGKGAEEWSARILTALKPSTMIMLCAPIVPKNKQESAFIKSYLI